MHFSCHNFVSGLMEPHVIVPVCSFSFAEQKGVEVRMSKTKQREETDLPMFAPPEEKPMVRSTPTSRVESQPKKKKSYLSLPEECSPTRVVRFMVRVYCMAPHGSAWLRMAPHGSAWLVRGPQATVSGLDVCHMEDEVRKPVRCRFFASETLERPFFRRRCERCGVMADEHAPSTMLGLQRMIEFR